MWARSVERASMSDPSGREQAMQLRSPLTVFLFAVLAGAGSRAARDARELQQSRISDIDWAFDGFDLPRDSA
jgi:hypothetical protein